MKTLKLVSMAMVCMAMVLVSCSGEDGEKGMQGEQGIPGVDGIDGTDGADGINCWDLNGNGVPDITIDETNEDINLDGVVDALDCQGTDGQNGVDGNANVQEHKFNLELFGNYSQLNFDLNDVVDNPNNYAYLYYIDHTSGLRYSIPGHLFNNNYYARVFTNLDNGTLTINFYDLSDVAFQVPGGEYTNLVVVAIELSNTGKTSENIMSELKAAGVDTSDYNAVAEYFGLE